MKTQVEPLEGNKVKLSVEVDESEFDKAIDAAFRRLARQVRIPGFRPGKAPRRLLEARLGTEAAREEALRETIPDCYERAVAEVDVDPISFPEFDITTGREAGPVVFEAVVEVRPHVRVAGHGGLRVVVNSPSVTEAHIDAQIDRLREQYGELKPVSRPAATGDHVSIDRRVYRHDETLLVTSDELYEVGKGTVAAELDDELRGAKAGDILKFNGRLVGADSSEEGADQAEEVSFQVLVKEIREKILPEATDEWAGEASEFDTLEELRSDTRERLSRILRFQATMARRERVLEALVELVDEDVPEVLVNTEIERRINELSERLESQGSDLGAYLESAGRSEDDFLEHLRGHAIQAVKADLGLRAVAEAEGIEVSDEDFDIEMRRLAEQLGEYKKAGVEVELVDFKGGSQALTAVIGGSADVVSGYFDHCVNLAAKGQHLQSFVVYDRFPGFALVAEAASGEEAIEMAAELAPDLVLMDINMGAVDGIEATRQITSLRPATKVILVSTYGLEDLPAGARASGAIGYVNKDELSPRAIRMIWEAGGDPAWLDFRYGARRGFEVMGVVVHAVMDDDVLGAAEDEHLAVDQAAEVAGAIPAVGERLGGRRLVAVVPAEDELPAQLQLTDRGARTRPRDGRRIDPGCDPLDQRPVG